MNSTWTVLATAFLLVGVLLAEARSEGPNRIFLPKARRGFMPSIRSIYSFLDPVKLWKGKVYDLSAIHAKALKDFNNRFRQASGETWFIVPGGFISYFQTAESEHRVFYTRKGCWEYSLAFYYEDSLPETIRASIKSNYHGYRITIVEQLTGHEGTNYIVHLENDSGIKHLRVTEKGEMDLLNEYTKSTQTVMEMSQAE